MSPYTITPAPGDREPFGDYEYEVFLDGRKVAHFSHDFRGEDPTVRVGAAWRFCDLLTGGGGLPMVVTEEGVRVLDEMLGRLGSG